MFSCPLTTRRSDTLIMLRGLVGAGYSRDRCLSSGVSELLRRLFSVRVPNEVGRRQPGRLPHARQHQVREHGYLAQCGERGERFVRHRRRVNLRRGLEACLVHHNGQAPYSSPVRTFPTLTCPFSLSQV